ncbi:MAG: hypothetical protein EOM23_01235 [Candidatus Moranbacteria bacterium]|nr:hypothetical protein [Candidatus Moranbacteria bacterium]
MGKETMRSKQRYYVRKLVTENRQKVLKDCEVDIFEVANTEGKTIARLILDLQEKQDELLKVIETTERALLEKISLLNETVILLAEKGIENEKDVTF